MSKQLVLGSAEWVQLVRDGAFTNRPPVPPSPAPKLAQSVDGWAMMTDNNRLKPLGAHHGKLCPYCHHVMAYGSRRFPTRDHVIPRSRGGRLDGSNCLIVCSPCNHNKDDMTLEEFAIWLCGRNDPRAEIVLRLLGPPREEVTSPLAKRMKAAFVAATNIPVEYDDPKKQAAFEAVYSGREHLLRARPGAA